MISVKNLSKKYGGRMAIDNLNFEIEKGDVVGFLGPNGAGKSTTMKIITGFMAPTSGEAKIAGFDVFENPIEVKKRIGYLPETPPVYTDMFVGQYLQYVAALKQVPKDKQSQFVADAIEKTNLGDVQKRLIGHLSKGFRQRVGIAQAIVSNPEVLILDEPTVGLDPKQMSEIRDLIKSLKGQHTIVLSTHILPEVQATCEKIIIINQGQIVAQDSIHSLEAMEKGRGRVQLRLKKSVEDLKTVLNKVSGLSKMEKGSTGSDWTVDFSGGDEVIDQISQSIVGSGLGLLELSPSKLGLEEVFIKLTYGSEAKQEHRLTTGNQENR